ncbi:hypothetical protein M407DRAFT_24784 [Tulasnella calospora MUT 4182]|uniref:Protein kinase domain-containing protein n=1 Tax=Tulasnella calospora MUT 4182 TaxID=1051891 RepID=A0A0C3QIT2_9AGAM|nr:hypothetical protein M407DRAFT_24784 [Tulasnella calospora MUT 4182]
MDLSGLSIADSGLSEPFGGTSQLNPRLQDKVSKLAKWRVDPSLIEFSEGTPEFVGGHATVSRALLTPASANEVNVNKLENGEGGLKSSDRNFKRKDVAVKKLKIEKKDDRERVLKLALREAGFLTELDHGHIIELEGFAADLPNDQIWLIFLWHEHGNLKDFVASQDWEIPERICLISDVTYGVQYLHSQDPPICHGDLKSINILVASDCRAVITDFGSARRLSKTVADMQTTRTEKKAEPAPEFQATFCATSGTMTFTGNEYTLRWAAPELLMDEKPGLSSDIWALGWICYEVMTNSVPFENVRKDAIIIKHVIDGKLPSVTDHARMSLIRQLCSLMAGCWSVDPTKRPTAEDCQKSMRWMPMIVPEPRRHSDAAASRALSPELLMQLGTMYRVQNDYANASKNYAKALDIYTENSDSAGKASALTYLARVHRLRAKYNEAIPLYSEALQICNDIVLKAEILWDLATIHKRQEEYRKAVAVYSEVLQIYDHINDKKGRAETLRGLAGVHRLQNDYGQALECYSEAIEIYSSLGDQLGKTSTLWALAEVHRLQKEYSQAVALFSESLQISTDIGNRSGIANALLGLANVHRDQDRHSEALCLYEQASNKFEQIGNTERQGAASRRAARARRRLEAVGAE